MRTITIDHPKGQFEITRVLGRLVFDGPNLEPEEWARFMQENKATLDKHRKGYDSI